MNKEKTKQKFESLKFLPGDIFTEMLSHWKVIVKNDSNKLTTIEGNSQKLELKEYSSLEEFVNHCSYKAIPGYWIDFFGNNSNKTRDFIEHYCSINNKSIDEVRDLLIDIVL